MLGISFLARDLVIGRLVKQSGTCTCQLVKDRIWTDIMEVLRVDAINGCPFIDRFNRPTIVLVLEDVIVNIFKGNILVFESTQIMESQTISEVRVEERDARVITNSTKTKLVLQFSKRVLNST